MLKFLDASIQVIKRNTDVQYCRQRKIITNVKITRHFKATITKLAFVRCVYICDFLARDLLVARLLEVVRQRPTQTTAMNTELTGGCRSMFTHTDKSFARLTCLQYKEYTIHFQ